MHGNRLGRLLTSTLAAALCAGAITPGAFAQLKKDKDKDKKQQQQQQNQQSQPGSNKPGSKAPPPPQPIADKVLQRLAPKDWTVKVNVLVQAGNVIREVDRALVVETRPLQFSSVAIVWPVLEHSAAHSLQSGEGGGATFKGEFFFNDALVDETPTIADGYQSGAKLARWEGRGLTGKDANLKLEINMNCYETRYDDKLAETIPWPEFWPPVPNSTFKPQMFVDFVGDKPHPEDTATIADFIKKATAGKDPKSIPPAQLAKYLAGQLLEAIQPSGDGLIYNSALEGLAGTIKGFDLRGAAQTLRDREGSEHDIACTTAAVFKAAGLPARTVIGWDMFDQKGGERLRRGASKGFRSWVEFCLLDPVSRQEIWIPVDVYRMRKAGSRAKPLDQPWKYFGTNDELAYAIPLAFQYHPPTTVMNLSPCLWGWLTNPETAPYYNHTMFTVFRAPRTSEQPGMAPNAPVRK
jgi:hypothetical protein